MGMGRAWCGGIAHATEGVVCEAGGIGPATGKAGIHHEGYGTSPSNTTHRAGITQTRLVFGVPVVHPRCHLYRSGMMELNPGQGGTIRVPALDTRWFVP